MNENEQHVRSVSAKAQKLLLDSIKSIRKWDSKGLAHAGAAMSRFQQSVCMAVLAALEHETPAAAAIRPLLDRVQWNIPIDMLSRRFSWRRRALDVTLLPANVSTFSQILAYMRSDSVQSILCDKKPISRNSFSTFFFCVRSVFAAWACQRLYVFHLLVPFVGGATSYESVISGFAQMDVQKDDGYRRTRKRSREEWSLWVDLFEVFQPYRRYGVGKRAEAQLVETDFAHEAAFVRLTPLESAEPFWHACGYTWSRPADNDGHLLKPIKRPRLQ